VDPDGLAPLMACCLVALDKQPGVRPIGICEVVRRIVAKAVFFVTRGDIEDAAGSLLNMVFNDNECEAVLLVDACNAFNSLNHQVALRNMN